VSDVARPFPAVVADPYAGHVDGLRRGAVVVRRCTGCGATQWPPRPLCAHCHGVAFDDLELDPRGEVHTFTVVHRAFHPWFAGRTPYAVAIVDLADGVRLTGFYDGDPVTVACGTHVAGTVEERGGAPALVWVPEVRG
jgi:uncharacterized protein